MTIISIGASATLGILAVFLMRGMIGKAQPANKLQHAQPSVPTASIVVAAQEIAFGDALKAADLKVVQWPEENIPKGAYSTLEPFAENNKTWRSALMRMAKNEPILDFKVSGVGQRQSLSLQIGPNMRAFAIRTDQTSGVGGFILPGDSVDVVLVRQLDNETRYSDNAVSDLIVQNVRVLGVDQNADARTEKTRVAKTVTVEVSPRDAQRLALAADLGELSLTLRRAGSETQALARQITIADLKVAKPARTVTSGNKRPKVYSRNIRIAIIRPDSRLTVSVPATGLNKQTQKHGANTFARLGSDLEGGQKP